MIPNSTPLNFLIWFLRGIHPPHLLQQHPQHAAVAIANESAHKSAERGWRRRQAHRVRCRCCRLRVQMGLNKEKHTVTKTDKKQKKKIKRHTFPTPSGALSMAILLNRFPPSRDTPPTPTQLLDRPQLLLWSHQSLDVSTLCASSVFGGILSLPSIGGKSFLSLSEIIGSRGRGSADSS